MPTGFCQRSRQLGCLRLGVSTHPLGKRFCSPAHAVPMRATSTKPSIHSNGIMLPATGATRWYSGPQARIVIPLGPLRGETEGHVCYSTWFARRSMTAARSGCLAPGVGCLLSEVDV